MVMLNRLLAFNKATVLMQGVLNGEEITKEHFSTLNTEGVYKELYQAAQSVRASGEFPDDYDPKVKPKKEIGETFLHTFNAFAAGKKPKEIAADRGMTLGTVYSHLGKFVAKGTIKIHAILDEDAIEDMTYAFKDFDGKSITGIKEKLNDKYSFDELRLFKIYWESLRAEDIF